MSIVKNHLAKFRNSNYAAHAGHEGSSGVQNHSVGEHYPVLSYIVGHDHCAAFQGIQRRTDGPNYSGHVRSLDLLKCAERIADAIYADRTGGSVWLNCDVDPDSGYSVSLYGHETQFGCIDGEYGTVYADVVEKLEWINGNGWLDRDDPIVCIGWWEHDGRIYLDVSVKIDDRDDAIDQAVSEGQLAIYDIASRTVLNVDAELSARNDPINPDNLAESTLRLYCVDVGGLYELDCISVAADSPERAAELVRIASGHNVDPADCSVEADCKVQFACEGFVSRIGYVE